jgi:hypothetical protein
MKKLSKYRTTRQKFELNLFFFLNRVEKYKNQTDLLTKKLDRSECEVNELVKINEVRN